jgi:lysophospholipase L1-like esterase
MFDDSQKSKPVIFAFILLCLSLMAMASLTGCGGNKNIPSASILTSGRVTLRWDEVPGTAAYHIYFSTSPGVTVLNSYKISNATTPITITDVEPATTYYFVVTLEDDSGQSLQSKEMSYTVVSKEGSIHFGDILNQSKAGAAVSTVENVPEAAPLAAKPSTKTEPQKRQSASTQTNAEIIICFGDSLTFGTGADKGMDYPSQLAKMIGKPVINEGLPGDTTTSALRRLNRDVLSKSPDLVLITLGGNDLKNGVSKDIAFDNLKQMVQAIHQQGAKIIIGGLRFPAMDRGFGKGYEDLAKQTEAILIPNIFEGIVENPDLMSDPIHPNNSGYRIIARRFYDAIASVERKPDSVVKAASPETRDVTLAWDDVADATSYNIYWSDQPGVTKMNATKISNVKNPHKVSGLKKGKTYFFVVTAVNASGESNESEEFSFTVGQ